MIKQFDGKGVMICKVMTEPSSKILRYLEYLENKKGR